MNVAKALTTPSLVSVNYEHSKPSTPSPRAMIKYIAIE
jgi:hypothetical protein